MKKLAIGIVAMFACLVMTGCMTERTHTVYEGEDTEDTAGIAEKDIRYLVQKVIQDIDRASMRYAKPNARRVINVKNIVVDTTARGMEAGYLAETIAQCFQEELMNGGKFIVYNEQMAQASAAAGRPVTIVPEFVMISKLKEQNVRRDNGNFYKEYSLLIKLADVATNLDFWQKRVPIQKVVDRRNVMN